MSNLEVRRRALDPRVQSLGQAINQNRSRWLGHVCACPQNAAWLYDVRSMQAMVGR